MIEKLEDLEQSIKEAEQMVKDYWTLEWFKQQRIVNLEAFD